jgi:hypothetical protein
MLAMYFIDGGTMNIAKKKILCKFLILIVMATIILLVDNAIDNSFLLSITFSLYIVVDIIFYIASKKK